MYTSIKSERRKHVTDNVEEKPNNIQLQRVHANIFRGLLNLVFFLLSSSFNFSLRILFVVFFIDKRYFISKYIIIICILFV